jgi:CRP-like cAMP-binding protein
MIKYNDLYNYYSKFGPLSEEDWLKLEANSKPIELAAGETIFKAQEVAAHAFVIRRGIIRTYYTTLEGKEFIKIFQTNGQMVSPYLENMMGIPPRATSEAVTDVSGVTIPFKTLIGVLDSSTNLIRLHLRLIQMFYAMKERREYELLTLDATQRYENFLQEYGEYAEQIPNMYIASYLGITPVSLSRLRRQIRN